MSHRGDLSGVPSQKRPALQAHARRVDEAAAAGIDTDVIDTARADAEKYQVPGCQLPQRHGVGRALLLGGGARNGHAHALVHVPRQPAAVEPAASAPPKWYGVPSRDAAACAIAAPLCGRGGAGRLLHAATSSAAARASAARKP